MTALAHEPALVVADEPTSALDTKSSANTLELFREITRDPDNSIIFVSHDTRAADYADHIVINHG